jgi:hypothetical protein
MQQHKGYAEEGTEAAAALDPIPAAAHDRKWAAPARKWGGTVRKWAAALGPEWARVHDPIPDSIARRQRLRFVRRDRKPARTSVGSGPTFRIFSGRKCSGPDWPAAASSDPRFP